MYNFPSLTVGFLLCDSLWKSGEAVFFGTQSKQASLLLFSFLTSLLRMMLMLQEISSCDTAECCGKEKSDDAAVSYEAAATSREGCARMCWNTLLSWLVCLSRLKSYRVHKMCFSAERLGKRVWVKIWGGSCQSNKQCLREARPVLENSLLQPTHNSSLLPALHIGTAYWKGQPQNDSEALLSNKKAIPCYFSDSCSKLLVFKNGCTDGC